MVKRYDDTTKATWKAYALERAPELLALLFPQKPMQIMAHEIRVGRAGSIAFNLRNGVWHCHEDGAGGDAIALIEYALHCEFKEALAWLQRFCGGAVSPVTAPIPPAKLREEDERRRNRQKARARAAWLAGRMVQPSSIAGRYLVSRGIDCAGLPDTLREHPSLYNFTTGNKHPALVAQIQDAAGEFMAIQAVFLTPEGRKISGEGVKAKLIWGACKGGAIRLGEPDTALTLCEGLEDGLTLRQAKPRCAVWVTCGTAGMGGVVLPDSVHEMLIASDSDAAGKRAAQRAAEQWTQAGRTVRIATPPAPFKDFNDMLMKEKAAM